ncbi:PREDICTED: uncharacterized protein LOC104770596 [Camelina sativa]|uniref:Uncharacterized protein LOC104770596 n=1 Tax=Camelina sativa TaxID=90675 RepID=A0ABM0XZT5_CAMSA|nr:PREDICTED: uncharacterized protein LOC104770596 [Camelina sativa]
MMLYLVLGSCIIGALLLVILLFLIYVLRELYYDAMGGRLEADKEARAEEEHLISPIRPSISADCTVPVQSSSSGRTKRKADDFCIGIEEAACPSADTITSGIPTSNQMYSGPHYKLRGPKDSDSD